MTNRQRETADLVGEFLLFGFESAAPDRALGGWLDRYHPAGVVLFARNFSSAEAVPELTRFLQSSAGPQPLLIAIDHEGGRVQRLPAPFTHFPPARRVAGNGPEAESAKRVCEAARAMAAELRFAGINWSLAPVLDVDTNPRNPVIGDRAFSSDPETTGRLGCAMIDGLEEGGVLSCGKHFPGHGDTMGDSHVVLPRIDAPRARLDGRELLPFRRAVAHGLPALMTAHVLYPALDSTLPATLSETCLRGLLREEIGFGGVIVSDDLCMKALSQFGTPGEVACRALRAGVDMILLSEGEEAQADVQTALAKAVRDGSIPKERLEPSLVRVRALRREAARLGAARRPEADFRAHADLARRLAARG